ncbi:hypothetical protein OC842_001956 [Tilletia horrida]|uniref:Uncharacterized protein n=1 Tax=Tilletia horrida TaxID=155126 RepID=A0AAN6GGV5_9BASI|nr:hypothetical protein OC842_001956 [Tilletia horrida]
MHHRTASVVPICSQPFEPTELIGREPVSLSSGRRRAYQHQHQHHHHQNRGSISSESESGSSVASSSSSSSSSSSVSAGAESPASLHHHQHHDDEPLGHADISENALVSLGAEPQGGLNVNSAGSHRLAAVAGEGTSTPSSSASSSPTSPTTLPVLFEAHLHYSRGLFDHTSRMWEADRQAIERSRDKARRDSASASSRLSAALGLGLGGSNTTSPPPAAYNGGSARRSSDARQQSQQRALFAGALSRRAKSQHQHHRRGNSAVV